MVHGGKINPPLLIFAGSNMFGLKGIWSCTSLPSGSGTGIVRMRTGRERGSSNVDASLPALTPTGALSDVPPVAGVPASPATGVPPSDGVPPAAGVSGTTENGVPHVAGGTCFAS